MSTSEEFKNDPVVFIAVNSGNEPKEVESYLNSVNCTWVGLADTDRSFEKACKVPEVSLRNIWQARVVAPDGTLSQADPSKIGEAVKAQLSKASWKVDPATVPEALKPAWKAVEFGDYALAMPAIKRSLRSSDEKTKAAAEAMEKAITTDLDGIIAEAAGHEKAGRKWDAYKAYDKAATQFRGYPQAAQASTAAKKLAADKDVRNEVRAANMLERAKGLLASRNRQSRRSGESMIASLAKEMPDTEAGQAAADIAKNLAPSE